MSLIVSYTLDRNNRIVDIGGEWDHFAIDNDARNLVAPNVLGRPIDEFIIGDATRMFLFTMLDCSRLLAKPFTRPYRCDSPQWRRYMEMTLEPTRQGTIELRHQLLWVEPIDHPVVFTVAPSGVRHDFVKRCSICNRLRIRNRWLEADEAAHWGLLAKSGECPVIYGVCETCQKTALPVSSA